MRKSTVIIIIVFLVGLNLYLATGWLLAEQQIRILEKEVKINQNNQRIISFIQLLTDTVLSGNQEISFDDRLSLEKAVRDLNDPDIFNPESVVWTSSALKWDFIDPKLKTNSN